MTIRLVAFTGVLGIGLAAGGCSSPNSPPPAQTPDVAPPSAVLDTGATAVPQGNADTAPLPGTPSVGDNDNADTAPPAGAPQATHQAATPSAPMASTPPPADDQAAGRDDASDNGPPGIVITQAPPPPRREAPPPPRAGFTWVAGYWNWDAGSRRHVWVRGQQVPMRNGSTWVPARWVHVQRGWQFHPGHWQGGGVRNPPVRPVPPPHLPPGNPPGHGPNPPPGGGITTAPPPPRIEPIVQRPGFVYTPGYWRWTGNRYDWVAGSYVRLRPGFHWVQAHWSQGPGGRWHLDQGHWEKR